jgi:hypothetical protein
VLRADPPIDGLPTAFPEVAQVHPTRQLADGHLIDQRLMTDQSGLEGVRDGRLDQVRRDIGVKDDQSHAGSGDVRVACRAHGAEEVVDLVVAFEDAVRGQVVGLAFGLAGIAVVLFGFFAVIAGSALETGMSCGYMLAQYFGWSWGKRVAPKKAARFHVAVAVSLLIGVVIVQTGADPVLITELALVGSAVALPLTYLPVLIVANDRQYLGDRVNGRLGNLIGVVTMVTVLAAGIAAIPSAGRAPARRPPPSTVWGFPRCVGRPACPSRRTV